MAKRPKKVVLKKRNLAAKLAKSSGAGPMKDKREPSRQDRKLRDQRGDFE